jgi:hypothetical protein
MRLSLHFSRIPAACQRCNRFFPQIVDKSVCKLADKCWIAWVQVGITAFLLPASRMLLWVSLWKSPAQAVDSWWVSIALFQTTAGSQASGRCCRIRSGDSARPTGGPRCAKPAGLACRRRAWRHTRGHSTAVRPPSSRPARRRAGARCSGLPTSAAG